MALVAQSYAKNARTIGIYPELKRPGYHRHYLSLSMEDKVLQSLQKGGYATAKDETVPRNLSQVRKEEEQNKQKEEKKRTGRKKRVGRKRRIRRMQINNAGFLSSSLSCPCIRDRLSHAR
jgi:glycerophosphoryl diester phosphodiesterase